MKFKPLGLRAPGADLLFSAPTDGDEHVALAFHPIDGGHDLLLALVDEHRAFLESDSTEGLLPILGSPEPGVYTFDLKGGRTLAEIIQVQKNDDYVCGEKAAIELLLQGAEVLAEATKAGAKEGMPAHGGLSPWRLIVDAEGYLDLFGYGLPNFDLLLFLDGAKNDVQADSLRYAPPERLEVQPEDIRSDLYALALIAVEMLTGESIFSDDPAEIIELSLSGKVPSKIEKLVGEAPDEILDLLCIATELDPDKRYADVEEFIEAAKAALDAAEGPSLLRLLKDALQSDVRVALNAEHGAEDEAAEDEAAEDEAAEDETAEDEAAEDEAAEDEAAEDEAAEDEAAEDEEDQAENTLEGIQKQAAALVSALTTTAEQIAARAASCKERAKEIKPDGDAIVRRAEGEAQKAEKAAKSAAKSADLVLLDDEISEAEVTLGFIQAASEQVQLAEEASLRCEQNLIVLIEQTLKEQKESAAIIAQTTTAAQGVAEAMEQLLAEAKAMEEGIGLSKLGAPGVEDSLQRATASLGVGQRAAATLDRSLGTLKRAKNVADARVAADAVQASIDQITAATEQGREAIQAAIAAEEAGRSALSNDAEAAAKSAEKSYKDFDKKCSEAEKALSESISESARTWVADARKHVETLQRAASESALEARQCASEEDWSDAQARHDKAKNALLQSEEVSAEIASLLEQARTADAEERKAHQAMSDAREASTEALKEVERLAPEVQACLTELVEDTKELEPGPARSLVDDARSSTERLLEAQAALVSLRDDIHGMPPDGDFAQRMEEVTEQVNVCKAAHKETFATAKKCRTIAAEELKEILKERERLKQLDVHASKAEEHATKAEHAVNAAMELYRGLPDYVLQSPIKQAKEWIESAFQTLDIAQFQATEARTAAQDARRQGDPNEAKGYADTAKSFWERIDQDVPEAVKSITRASDMVEAERSAIAKAKERSNEAVETVGRQLNTANEMLEGAKVTAAPWSQDASVSSALEGIRSAAGALAKALDEAKSSSTAASKLQRADQATSITERASAALQGASSAINQLNQANEQLAAAVGKAERELADITGLRDQVAEFLRQSGPIADDAISGQSSLTDTIAENAATSIVVKSESRDLITHIKSIAKASRALTEADKQIRKCETLADAKRFHKDATAAFAQLQTACNNAKEAVRKGIEAAEQEAKERAAADEKRKADARKNAEKCIGQTRDAVAAVRHARGQANEIVQHAPEGPAHEQLAEGERLLKELEAMAAEVEEAVEEARTADEAVAVLDAASTARATAKQANSKSKLALETLRIAQEQATADIARAKELAEITTKMETLVVEATGHIERARAFSVSLDTLLEKATTDKTRRLRNQADRSIADAEKALKKINASLPMVAQAESAQVANRMLVAATRAAKKTEDEADAMGALVERAKERLEEEERERMERLEAKRNEVLALTSSLAEQVQATQASVAATTKGAEDVSDYEDVASGLDDLVKQASAVEKAYQAIEGATEPVKQAADLPTLEAAEISLREAIDAVNNTIAEHAKTEQAVAKTIQSAKDAKAQVAEIHEAIAAALELSQGAIKAARGAFASFEKVLEGSELHALLKGETAAEGSPEAAVDLTKLSGITDRIEDALRAAGDALFDEETKAKATGEIARVKPLQTEKAALDLMQAATKRAIDTLTAAIEEGKTALSDAEAQLKAEREAAAEQARLAAIEEQKAKEMAAKRAARPRPPAPPPAFKRSTDSSPPPFRRPPAPPAPSKQTESNDVPLVQFSNEPVAPSIEQDEWGDVPTEIGVDLSASQAESPPTADEGPMAAPPQAPPPAPRASRLRPPARLGDDADSPARRRARRVRDASEDGTGRTRRRRIRASQDQSEGPSSDDRDDLRARLKQRRASRMRDGDADQASGSASAAPRPSGRPRMRRRSIQDSESSTAEGGESPKGSTLPSRPRDDLRKRLAERTRNRGEATGPARRPRLQRRKPSDEEND